MWVGRTTILGSGQNDWTGSFFVLAGYVFFAVVAVLASVVRGRAARRRMWKRAQTKLSFHPVPNLSKRLEVPDTQRLIPGGSISSANLSNQYTAGGVETAVVQGAAAGRQQFASKPALVRRASKLGLDAGIFQPLSDEEVRRRAGGAGSLWGNPWFGRRDLIPPISDPRTLLIDQAMVGHGLLTPEDLTEIHQVGDEMDAIRVDLSRAATTAAKAVEASQEDRERIKAEKKAAAAERKRLHAEAVAERRRADIVFLGRGVSRELADRRSNVEKLRAAGLPVLATPADVATALGLSIPRLRWLAFHSDAATVSHYIRFTVPKRKGGTRQLAAPHADLAEAQQWILRNILDRVPIHDAAHGFVRGRSVVTNAKPHVGRRVVLNADLADFFPTITFPRVRGVFKLLGYSPAVATILALLCTESPRRAAEYAGKKFHVATSARSLPQGACTSPALSNLAARRMDARLSGIASRLGWTYTRYADDFTFSADGDAGNRVGYLVARLRHIADDEGFTVHEQKTRVLRRNTAQSVTGVIVNDRPGISRETVRQLRAILHRAKTEGLAAQNRAKIPAFEAHIKGMISYIHMVNPAQAAPLRAAYEALQV